MTTETEDANGTSTEYRVVNGYLVEATGEHNCAGGTPEAGYAHEQWCGYEPLGTVEDLLKDVAEVVSLRERNTQQAAVIAEAQRLADSNQVDHSQHVDLDGETCGETTTWQERWARDLHAILAQSPSSVLESHDRETRAKALEDAADEYRSGQLTGMFIGRYDYYKAWLRDRASKIREGK